MSEYVFLVGRGIGYSLSPAMQGAAAAALGLDWEYKLLDLGVDSMEGIRARLASPDCLGANITLPFKEKIVDYCQHLDQFATRLGAVNTIVNRTGQLWGYNTDLEGLARDLQRLNISLKGKRVAIVGGGGAAASALSLCSQSRVTLVCRNSQQGDQLLRRLGTKAKIFPWTTLLPQDLVINCTPPSSGWQSLVSTASVVYDLNYTQTYLRPNWHNGLGMLLYQGAASFKLWTGQAPPLPEMAKILGIKEPF